MCRNVVSQELKQNFSHHEALVSVSICIMSTVLLHVPAPFLSNLIYHFSTPRPQNSFHFPFCLSYPRWTPIPMENPYRHQPPNFDSNFPVDLPQRVCHCLSKVPSLASARQPMLLRCVWMRWCRRKKRTVENLSRTLPALSFMRCRETVGIVADSSDNARKFSR